MLVLIQPSEGQAAEYDPSNALDFWTLLQYLLQLDMDRQLSSIHEIACMYQERNNVEIGYL